jgi:peptidylprolyl isomerase
LLILNLKQDIILSTVNKTDTVKVHYTGKTDDGVVFDSSREREPLQFTMGQGQLIPGFENAVEGMKTGETTTVRIPSEEAYGEVKPEMMVDIERKQIPPDIKPELGMVLQMQQPNGQPMNVTVKGVTDTHVTLDANHPLAGEALTFDIELVEIL